MSKSSSLVLWGLLIVALAVLACDAQREIHSCPSHETYFQCGDNCQTKCATLGEFCLIRHIRCPDGCYCNKGFARDASGKCIPISECPPKQ